MKKLIWTLLYLILTFGFLSSCGIFDEDSRKFQLDEIEELKSEILALSESVPCTNSTEWKFTPMGSKACGGPTHYIAYHQSVEADFLELVSQYTTLQAEYNKKNNVVSDCLLIASPKSVSCEGGKAILVK